MINLLLILLVLIAAPALATDRYVSSTGNGAACSQANPCAITQAAGVVNAGDNVYLRGGTYSIPTLSLSRSGSIGSLITWQPEPSTGTVTIRSNSGSKLYNQTPIIQGSGVSYNKFTGLSFCGASGSLAELAIYFVGTNAGINYNTVHSNARGNQITNNTFSNCGHDGTGGTSYFGVITLAWTEDSILTGNTISSSYGVGVRLAADYNDTVDSNTIGTMRGSCFYGVSPCNLSGNVTSAAIWNADNDNTWTPGSTVKQAGYNIVSNNTINAPFNAHETSAIRCDAGGHNMRITGNTISNQGTVGDTGGIYMESRCRNNLIARNVVTNSKLNFTTSSPSISSTDYNTWVNNTSYGGQIGFAVRKTTNSLYVNNISVGAVQAAIATSTNASSNTYRNNLYYRSGNPIGYWNSTDLSNEFDTTGLVANLTLAQWNTQSGETADKSVDPLFTNAAGGNFTLQPSSQAINAGSTSTSTATLSYTVTYNGAAPDIGALETTDTIPPTVTVTSPANNSITTTSPITMSGTAADNTAVTSVTWSCSTCTPTSGTAAGTTAWSVASIGLASGANTITAVSHDAAGNNSTPVSVTVTFNPGYWISKSGNDSNGCTSSATPLTTTAKLTIGAGLACLKGAGDSLTIGAGTYTENIVESQLVSGTSYAAPILIQGQAGSTITLAGHIRISSPGTSITKQFIVFKHLILDGTSDGADQSCVSVGGGANGGTVQNIKFEDLECKNFTGDGFDMGGDDSTGQTLWLTNVKVHDGGGGSPGFRHCFYVQGSNNIIEDSECYNYQGFGVHNYSQNATPPTSNIYRRNKIHNTGTFTGRVAFGVALFTGSNNQAYNNLIYANQGGVNVENAALAANNTLYANGVGFGGQCCYPAIVNLSGANSQITNNLIIENQINSIDTTGSTGATLLTNVTSGTAANTFVNAAGGDFHLLSTASNALDVGTNLSGTFTGDFANTARPQGSAWDVGAYERVNTPPPTIQITVPTLNPTGYVTSNPIMVMQGTTNLP